MKVMLHLSSWNLISRSKQNFKPNVADLEPGWFKLIDHWSCDEVSNRAESVRLYWRKYCMMDRVKVDEFGILFIVETRMKWFWFFLLRNIELRG